MLTIVADKECEMDPKSLIIKKLEKQKQITTDDVSDLLGISRQGAQRHLKTLIGMGRIIKIGKTRGSYYILNDPSIIDEHFLNGGEASGNLENKNLEEDRVLSSIKKNTGLLNNLKPNVASIIDYAFTEILNNAIDHSKSKNIHYQISRQGNLLSFEIRDQGIGVYANIMEKFRLSSEYESLEELQKGKSTTDPKRHSGEGIYFTSKISDRFKLTSHKIEWFVDNPIDEYFVKEVRQYNGTKVLFEIDINTSKELQNQFAEFSNEDFEFDTSKVKVNMFSKGNDYISRSQAKRLLAGLEKYRVILLDFKGVQSIGQGFADQVFRVFQGAHPAITIEVVNCLPAVTFMIERVGENLPAPGTRR